LWIQTLLRRGRIQKIYWLWADHDRGCFFVAICERFIITDYLVGAFAAVCYAVNKQGQFLTFKDGAEVGFLGVKIF